IERRLDLAVNAAALGALHAPWEREGDEVCRLPRGVGAAGKAARIAVEPVEFLRIARPRLAREGRKRGHDSPLSPPRRQASTSAVREAWRESKNHACGWMSALSRCSSAEMNDCIWPVSWLPDWSCPAMVSAPSSSGTTTRCTKATWGIEANGPSTAS